MLLKEGIWNAEGFQSGMQFTSPKTDAYVLAILHIQNYEY